MNAVLIDGFPRVSPMHVEPGTRMLGRRVHGAQLPYICVRLHSGCGNVGNVWQLDTGDAWLTALPQPPSPKKLKKDAAGGGVRGVHGKSDLHGDMPPDDVFDGAEIVAQMPLLAISPAWALVPTENRGNCAFSALAVYLHVLQCLGVHLGAFGALPMQAEDDKLINWRSFDTQALMHALRMLAVDAWRDAVAHDAPVAHLFPDTLQNYGTARQLLDAEARQMARDAVSAIKGKKKRAAAAATAAAQPLRNAGDYLDEMAKDGVFATTNELAILAHVLGIAIAVVSAYHGDDDVVYEVYNEEAEHAVFLYNSGYHFEPLLPLARLQALRAAGVHFAGKLRSYF